MNNEFFSYDISSAFFSILAIVIWIVMIRVIVGLFARIALTIVAVFVILWAVGQADDVAQIALNMVETTWTALKNLWNSIF